MRAWVWGCRNGFCFERSYIISNWRLSNNGHEFFFLSQILHHAQKKKASFVSLFVYTRCSPPLSWVRVPLWYLAQQPGLVCLYVSRGDSQLEGWAAMEGMTAFNERLCLVTSVESCWSELDFMDLLTFDPKYSRRVLISFVFYSKIVIITQNSTCVMAQPLRPKLTCGHPAVFHQHQGGGCWARPRSGKENMEQVYLWQ